MKKEENKIQTERIDRRIERLSIGTKNARVNSILAIIPLVFKPKPFQCQFSFRMHFWEIISHCHFTLNNLLVRAPVCLVKCLLSMD